MAVDWGGVVVADFSEGLGGGLGGLLPLLLLGGGGLGGGLGSSGEGGGGLSPLLLLLLLGQGQGQNCESSCSNRSCSSSSSGGEAPANFQDYLTANIGRRIKIMFPTQTMFLAGQEITARLIEVGSDYVVIDRICVNGVPILDPRRLTMRNTEIVGLQPLTGRDRFIELICALD